MGAPKGNKFALGNRGGKGGPLKYDRRYAKIAALAYSAGHIIRKWLSFLAFLSSPCTNGI